MNDTEMICRPGGFALTDQLCKWMGESTEGRKILDIGCGNGATLRYLRSKYPKQSYYGLDPSLTDEQLGAEIPSEITLMRARGEAIPLENDSMDVVLMECSFSRTENPSKVLSEIHRVLRWDGILLVSDMYSRSEKSRTSENSGIKDSFEHTCTIGRLESASAIQKNLDEAGFHVFRMEDTSVVLGDWIGQMILDDRADSLQDILGMDWKDLKKYRPGYYLMAAEVSQIPGLLQDVKTNSIFYQCRYQEISVPSIPDSEENILRSLPLMDAEMLRRDPEGLLCTSPRDIARIITLQSSGSTGKPKRIFFTEKDLDATADFFDEGIRWLVRPEDRVAVFMEGPAQYSVGGLLKEGLSRLPAEVYVHGMIRDYAHAAKLAEGMDTLIGIPSQLYRLAKYAPELRPRTVLLSADNVPEVVKETMEAIWQCRVFTHWGMSETGYGGGVQCSAREGYHLRHRHLILEILDPKTGQKVPDGEFGEIVLTTLHRKGMPLIRYRTGDLAAWMKGPCPCGCLLPRLSKIKGRIKGGIPLDHGLVLRMPDLDEMVYRLPILAYQANWNEEKGQLNLHLLADPCYFKRIDESEKQKKILKDELVRDIRRHYDGTFAIELDWIYNEEDNGSFKRSLVKGDPY